jgi:hypothetical protein
MPMDGWNTIWLGMLNNTPSLQIPKLHEYVAP